MRFSRWLIVVLASLALAACAQKPQIAPTNIVDDCHRGLFRDLTRAEVKRAERMLRRGNVQVVCNPRHTAPDYPVEVFDPAP